MRPPRLLLIALLCAALAPVLPHTRDASAFQHVRNGGFEDGAAGWSPAPGTTIETVGASTGSVVALVTSTSGVVRIAQPLDAALGAGDYRISLQVRSEAGDAEIAASLQTGSARHTVSGATESGAWAAVAGDVTLAAATNVTLIIEARTTPGTAVYIDDIRIDGAPPVVLTPTPEPTPSPLVAASLTPGIGATATVVPTATAAPAVIDAPLFAAMRNGDFEDTNDTGAPAAWERYGGSVSTATDPVHSGRAAARFESTTDSTKWLHQSVGVAPGHTYEFSAWIWNDDPNVAAAFLRVSWYASNDASGSAIDAVDSLERVDAPAAQYRFLTTGAIAAPADARSARARILLAPVSGAPAVIHVDDAWFGEVAPLAPAAPLIPAAPNTIDADGAPASAGPTRASRVTTARTATQARLAGAPQSPGARVVINEVLYDPIGEGADADGEWIELYNAGSADVDLAGWSLADALGADVLPPMVLRPGAFAIVAASAAPFAALPDAQTRLVDLGGRIGNGLGNEGDRLLLLAPDGAVIDAVSWGTDHGALDPPVDDVPAGHSIERARAGGDSDDAADFVDNASPSPGREIESIAASPQQPNRPSIEVLSASGSAVAWVPWAIAAASIAALAATGGWRLLVVVRERVR